MHGVHFVGTLVKVQRVKAHRSKSKKEMQKMSLFEQFITDGLQKADELTKQRVMLVGGDMAQMRAITGSTRKRERFMQHCNTQPVVTVYRRNGKIVKNSDLSQKRSGLS